MTNAESCKHCARVLHTGEGRVLIALTVAEAAELANATLDPNTKRRLALAIALLDEETAAGLW